MCYDGDPGDMRRTEREWSIRRFVQWSRQNREGPGSERRDKPGNKGKDVNQTQKVECQVPRNSPVMGGGGEEQEENRLTPGSEPMQC